MLDSDNGSERAFFDKLNRFKLHFGNFFVKSEYVMRPCVRLGIINNRRNAELTADKLCAVFFGDKALYAARLFIENDFEMLVLHREAVCGNAALALAPIGELRIIVPEPIGRIAEWRNLRHENGIKMRIV